MSQEELRAALEVEPEQEAPEVESPQLNEVEQEAYKEGWRPETEFAGEKSKWIPADEFMRRKPLFAKIDELKTENFHTRKEMQEVKSALKAFTEHHKKVEQVAYDRALKNLQAQRREAFSDHDLDRVMELEEKMEEVKAEKAEFEQTISQQTAPQAQPTPEYLDWVKSNQWYLTESDMHDAADGIAYAYVRKNPNLTAEQVYTYVTDKIQKAYPEKFSSVRKPSPVDSGGSQNRTPAKGFRRLTAEEDQVAKTWERLGVMTRDEYIAELKKTEEK